MNPPDPSGTSTPRQRARWLAYLLAVGAVAATFGLRLGFASWFDDRRVLVLFVLPIFLSAYVGGLGPGLVATVVAGLGVSYFLIPPLSSFAMERPADMVQWLILISLGVLISFLAESLHRARTEAQGAAAKGGRPVSERAVQGGFGLALVFLGMVAALSVFSVTRLRTDTGWATHTEEVISSLRLLLSAVTDAETAERGYIITDEEGYLAPYDGAPQVIQKEMTRLRKLTDDNHDQQRQLDRLAPLIAERMALAEHNIALRHGQQLTPGQAATALSAGKSLHDHIRQLIAEMEATEQGLLREREDRVQTTSTMTRTIIIGGGTLAFVFVATALFVMNREFAIRRRTEAALRAARDQLEARVRERTAELERTNAALRESGALFSEAFRLSPDFIAIVRASDRTLVRANEAVARLWGGTPEQLVGRPTNDYTNWVDEEERLEFMRTLQERGECLDHETTLRLRDGRLVDFNLSCRLIMHDGTPCILSVMRDITERRRADAVAAQLVAIVESSDDAIIGKDLAGVVTSWNAGAEKIFGYVAEEMIGRSISVLIPPERRHEEEDILLRLRRGESVRHFDTVRLRKDGRPIDISVTVSAIRDAAGKVTGASKVARDITERKEADRALRATQARLSSALAAGSIGTWTWDIANDRLTADEFTARVFSVDVDTAARGLPAADYLQAVVEEDKPKVSEGLAAAIKSGGHYDLEYRVRQKDGGQLWLQARGRVEGDRAGKAAYFHGAVMDITERKEAEQIMRKSQEELQDLFDNAPLGYHELDLEGRIVRTNSTELKMLGYTREELLGRPVWTLLEDPAESRAATLAKLAGAEQSMQFERRFRCKDGTILPVLVQDRVLRDARGVIRGSRAALQDITELKRVEDAIRQLNAELERRVEDRTAQLLAANQELEAFTYSVSHDLRTPLRAIDGFSQAVLEDFAANVPPDGQRYLRTIRESAQRMGELIDDLLAFSRLNRQSLHLQPVDTEKLVRSALADLQAHHAGRRIAFQIGALPPCAGDPALLKQVWLNLLANAVKYTRRQPEARIEIGSMEQSGEQVFFVRDNGTGFDMQYAHKLFGVFQRLHRTEDYEGTGVGLAIVQRIVHRHGGRVWAQAALNQGATFSFTLGNIPNS